MKTIYKIMFLFTLFLGVVILREFVSLASDLFSLSFILGWLFILLTAALLYYFALLPAIKLYKMPKIAPPTKDQSKKESLAHERLNHFYKNPLLSEINFNAYQTEEGKYNAAIEKLKEETEKIRKSYVPKVFYSTAFSQNGVLDSLIILSAGINMVKDIFTVYNGRATNKDLLLIMKKIYSAMAIGGSDSVVYASDEILTAITSGGIKSIPFADKVFTSITDGFVSAMLLTRISYIAENYCSLLYIESDKELMPSYKTVLKSTKYLTSDGIEQIKNAFSGSLKQKGDAVIGKTKEIFGGIKIPFNAKFRK